MTKRRFLFFGRIWIFLIVLLLMTTGDSLAQPTRRPRVETTIRPGDGQVISREDQIIQPGMAYFIKSKGSQKVLEVSGQSLQPGAAVKQNRLTGYLAQKFIFTDAGGGYFFIRTSPAGYYVTLEEQVVLRRGRRVGDTIIRTGGITYLTQQLLSNDPQRADAQKWRIGATDEPTSFFILNKTNETVATLQPTSTSDGAIVGSSPRDGNNLQKWILKVTTAEANPNVALAENGLVSDCFASIEAFVIFKYSKNISQAFPEWRSVGENYVPDGVTKPPLRSYKILEGVVSRDDDIHVASQDLPSAHFTHDFTFSVNPDSPFRYLLGKDRDSLQDHMEVEWESGLAQGDDRRENPAAIPNRRGDSFGFYSAGHQRQEVIWQWPTANDWVHVEGIWIVDRGHNKPRTNTEIHPAHFVAVKRDLPAKYEPVPGQYFFATRTDIFANGDGNVIWNNKGLHPFAQPVKMSERVYTVIVKHDLPRPNSNARLKYAFQTQQGDTYPSPPRVEVFENGSPDVPEPHVRVSVAWASDRAPDTAIFGRTLFLYWDDVPSHGVPATFPMKKIAVTLEKILIQDKREGNDADPGEYRLFADMGGRWLFLNEFTGASDIISEGLGEAWDPTYSANHPIQLGGFSYPYPKPPHAEYEFHFNQTFESYVPQGKELRFAVEGWEGDYMDNQFGKIVNPYLPCEAAVDYLETHLNGTDFANQGKTDDPVGEAGVFLSYEEAVTKSYSVESVVGIKDRDTGENTPDKAFRAYFRVTVAQSAILRHRRSDK